MAKAIIEYCSKMSFAIQILILSYLSGFQPVFTKCYLEKNEQT